MKNPELWKHYTLSKVKSHNQKVNHYIGTKQIPDLDESAESEVLVDVLINEICDREKIELYISDFLSMKANDPLNILVDCFTDNSNFYVIFRYVNAQDIVRYLKKENPSYTMRMTLLITILEKLLQYESYPGIIASSVLLPENIWVDNGRVDFNVFLDLNAVSRCQGDQDVYLNIHRLINVAFSEKEIESQPKLSIIQKKLAKFLYKSVPEVIRDMDELYRNLTDDKNRTEAVKDARKNLFLKTATYLLVFALLLTAASVLVLFNNSKKKVSVYLDTTEIGTVKLESESNITVRPEADAYILVNNGDKAPVEQEIETVTQPEMALEAPKSTEAPTIIVVPDVTEAPVQDEPMRDETTLSELDYERHTVMEGDTLWDISGRYFEEPYAYPYVAEFNDIDNPDLIYPGQVFAIPIPKQTETPDQPE